MRTFSALVLVVSCFHATLAHAQSDGKVPVSAVISVGENDSTGRRLAFEVKEQLRASRRCRMVVGNPYDDDAVKKNTDSAHITLSLLTLPTSNISTAVSIAVSWDSQSLPVNGLFMTHYVEICGENKIEQCAKDILATFDEQLDKLASKEPALWKALEPASK
jgi:hypothetical protein